MIALLALLGRAQAADVLIPEATPASMSDFSVAYMVYDLVVGQVENKGLDVLDADELREVVDGDADACADLDDCPAKLWDRTDARLAVVIAIGQADGGLNAEVRLYGWDNAQPLKTIRKTIPGGGEVAFAQDIAKQVAAAIQLVPEREEELGSIGSKPTADEDEDDVPAPSFDEDEDEAPPPKKSTKTVKEDPVEDWDEEEEEPKKSTSKTSTKSKSSDDEEEEVEEPKKSTSKSSTKSKSSDDDEDESPKKSSSKSKSSDDEEEEAKKKADPPKSAAKTKEPPPPPKVKEPSPAEVYGSDPKAVEERRKMGVPWSAYADYRESGMDQAAWLKKAQVHSGKAYIGAAGGYTLGDIDRGYDVRVGLDSTLVTTGSSSWTGPGAGSGINGRLEVGYIPAWFVDTSVAVGLQTGKKKLTVGWECSACEEQVAETPYAAVDATQLFIEPRAKFLPLATGYVKPYALVGFTFAVYDGFHIPDEEGAVDYPDIDGGAAFGPTAGIGVMIDPVSPISIVIEAPFNLVLSDGEAASVDPDLEVVPTTLENNGWVLRVVGGVAVRF